MNANKTLNKPKSSLQAILKEINAAKELAATPVENIPAKTAPGILMAMRAASGKLATLKLELAEALAGNMVAFVPEGTNEQIADFAKVSEKLGTVSYYGRQLAVTAASKVELTMGGSRTFNLSQMEIFMNVVKDEVRGMDAVQVTTPKPKMAVVLTTTMDVVKFLQEQIDAFGPDFAKAFTLATITKKVLTTSFEKPTLGVVLVGMSAKQLEYVRPLFKKVTPIVISSETVVDEAFVSLKYTGKKQPAINSQEKD